MKKNTIMKATLLLSLVLIGAMGMTSCSMDQFRETMANTNEVMDGVNQVSNKTTRQLNSTSRAVNSASGTVDSLKHF